MRRAVLIELAASPVPLSAYGLTHALTLRYRQKRHANSVYRSLWALMTANEVVLIASWRKYAIRQHDREADAWLLCENCNTAEPVCAADTVAPLALLASAHDFRPSKIVLEVLGECESCRNRQRTETVLVAN